MRRLLFWAKFARTAITVERDGIVYLITADFVVIRTSMKIDKMMNKTVEMVMTMMKS